MSSRSYLLFARAMGPSETWTQRGEAYPTIEEAEDAAMGFHEAPSLAPPAVEYRVVQYLSRGRFHPQIMWVRQ